MSESNLLKTGIAGTVLAAICCFTPLLALLLTGVGLSAIIVWLDYGLFPILFASLGLIAYALYLRSGRKGPSPNPIIVAAVIVLSALLIWLEFKYALRISVATAAAVGLYAFYLRQASSKGTI